jgi:hypothetical protein
MVDANMLKHVQENAVQCIAICLETDKTPLQTPAVTMRHPWFGHLIALTI